eukprot:1398567-Prymnesium_polylepis.1
MRFLFKVGDSAQFVSFSALLKRFAAPRRTLLCALGVETDGSHERILGSIGIYGLWAPQPAGSYPVTLDPTLMLERALNGARRNAHVCQRDSRHAIDATPNTALPPWPLRTMLSPRALRECRR